MASSFVKAVGIGSGRAAAFLHIPDEAAYALQLEARRSGFLLPAPIQTVTLQLCFRTRQRLTGWNAGPRRLI
jgi:hypothetical protein